MNILNFIFRDFWTWLGTLILIATFTQIRLFTIDKHVENNYCKPEQPDTSEDAG